MMRALAAFASGLMFALGLALSGMTRPSKVQAFLDVGGDWDASLALVMVGANAVFATAFHLSRRMRRPLLVDAFAHPVAGGVNRRLIAGAVLFGVGWGLSGYCPGPAFVALGAGVSHALAFVAAMLVGMGVARAIESSGRQRPRPEAVAE
jgi:uncharacterized protein